MNIEKRYWKWDEILNKTEYKLGGEIAPLISKGLIKESDDLDEYSVTSYVPKAIRARDGKITHIFYERNFEGFLNAEVWELKLKDFETSMSKIVQPCKQNDEGDKLVVIFRDFFVAVAYITRFQKNEL